MKKLTTREQDFIITFLKENDCNAKSTEDLLEDNHSCQCMLDLRNINPSLSNNEIAGFVSSLIEKGVLSKEERSDEVDLYWVTDSFLENNIHLSW